jgi:glutathione reductase (NADPH)
MTDYDYDLFVIGAGSGGVRAARIAAGYGARVAIAEEYRIGGTCVIRGCVPKKLLVYASRFADEFEDAAGFGWSVPEPSFDWARLIANKDKEIARLEGIYRRNLENAGVEIHLTRACLRGPNTVHLVAEGRDVTARTILIATGGHPNYDRSLPGIEHVISSNEAFHLEQLPRSIVIAGGGYISVEFAGIFNGLGVDTTLIYRGPEILRGFDDDLRATLHREMEKRGITVICGDVFTQIEKNADGLVGHTKTGRRLEADKIMFAIGRSPNIDGLCLPDAGVQLGWNGHVVVDEYSRTNVASIYAVGDVTDRLALTPVAIREGHAFAETVFNDNPTPIDHETIPTAVFSTPEIGTVGLTEAEARERCRAVDVYTASFRPIKLTLTERDEKMLMKLVVDAESDCVMGCHLLGPDSGELIQVLGILVRMGATKAQFDSTVAVHPTAAEELVTMRTPTSRWAAQAAAE